MIYLLLLAVFAGSLNHPTDMVELRNLFYSATKNKEDAILFQKKMSAINVDSDATLAGYQGMAYMLQAKYAINPYTKLNNFIKGKSLLDKAISKAPKSLELRFMRFSVQTNAPFFLNYNGNIGNDKTVIIQGWKKLLDKDLKNRIKDYMLKTKYCKEAERSIFLVNL